MKWKNASGVICDGKSATQTKRNFYGTNIKPTILHGTECWVVKSQQESKSSIAKMRMLW